MFYSYTLSTLHKAAANLNSGYSKVESSAHAFCTIVLGTPYARMSVA